MLKKFNIMSCHSHLELLKSTLRNFNKYHFQQKKKKQKGN